MPNAKRIISLITVTLVVIMAIFGIIFIQSMHRDRAADPDVYRSGKNQTLKSETKTSRDISCYILGSAICDENGKKQDLYQLDTDNNIVDLEGNVVVFSEDTIPFSCVRSISYDNSLLRQVLTVETVADGKTSVLPNTFSIRISVTPEDAVNRTITLKSDKTEVLSFPLNENRMVLADDPKPNSTSLLPALTVIPDSDGTVEVSFTANSQGHAEVTVTNILGEKLGEMEFVFLSNPAKAKRLAAGSSSSISGTGSMISAGNGTPSIPAAQKTGTDGHEHVFKTRTMTPTVRTQGYTIHVCEICGYTYRDNYTDLITCSHNWRLVKTVPVTDVPGGYSLYECTQCGQQERRNLIQETPAEGSRACSHVICSKTVVPATCNADGYTIHECLICHDYSYRDEETPALGHSFGDGAITKEPSCNDNGLKTYTCVRCGETKTESIPAIGHVWDDGIITVTPALESRGIKTYTCKTCGETRSEELPALENDWDDGVITTPPTCTETGIKTYTCRNTGQTRTEELPMVPHTIIDEVIEPTHEAGGYTRHYCSVCGYELEHTDPTEPLAHQHSYESVQIAPTCTEDGYSASVCTVCGNETDREVLAATGHDYVMTVVEPAETEDGYIEFSCSKCNDSYQKFLVPAFTAQESEDTNDLDLDQIIEAGNQWLRENGMEINADVTDEDLTEVATYSVPLNVSQETAEAVMRKTCFEAVANAVGQNADLSRQELVFSCTCDREEESGLYSMNCMYTIVPGES